MFSNRKRRIAIVILASGVLVAGTWFTVFVANAREQAFQARVTGRLSQVALMLNNYKSEKGRLPPVFTTSERGDRLQSWRLICLLNSESDGPLGEFMMNEAWNIEHNLRQVDPNCAGYFSHSQSNSGSFAHVLAVTGPNSLWDEKTGLPNPTAASRSDVVMLVAVPESDILWMEPRDVTESELALLVNRGISVIGITAKGQTGAVFVREGVCRIQAALRENPSEEK